MDSTHADEAGYRPTLDDEAIARIRAWHEAANVGIRRDGPIQISYLDREFVVPPDVFPTAGMSDLLGRAVLDEVRESDRVLDMGTGCGVNAVLAAGVSTDVLGVDINEHAVEAATVNAALNGVTAHTRFRYSDVFSDVDGDFDLIIIDPPFRWFAARDILEASITDENYRVLTTFITQVGDHLREGGRVLLFFGTSGDLDYLCTLTDAAGLRREVVASRELTRDDHTVAYYTFRLTKSHQ